MKKLVGISVVAGAILFTGCGPKSINMSDYPDRVSTPVSVPDVCQSQYEALKSIPRVAVLPFTNNSSFGKANVETGSVNIKSNSASLSASSSVSAGVRERESVSASRSAGVVAVGNGVAAGVSANESASASREASVERRDSIGATVSSSNTNISSNRAQRVVDPKLDKAITSQLEGMLADMGGVDVYSRSDLQKVINEQKLQQSGLVDEKTAVKLGKLAGVKYIITGSIDGVTIKLEDYRKVGDAAAQAGNRRQQQDLATTMFKMGAKFLAAKSSGWKITTSGTIKIIDTETGKIIYSKPFEETTNIGMVDNPQISYEDKIGGIKEDIKKAVEDSKEELSKFFAPKGYIIQVKTDRDHKNYIALINLGSKDKVKPGQEFKVFSFEKVVDPMTHKASCSLNTLAVTLTVAKNQVQTDKSWTYADGEDANKLRPGQMIQRKGLKNSMLSF